MFSGSLAEINLAEILRLLHSSNQSGVLLLTEDGKTAGAIYLQLGQITHAEAGPVAGLDALNSLVGASKATFAFQAGVSPAQQTLSPYPTPKLLEKLQKRVAEVIDLQASLPKPTDIPKYIANAASTSVQATPQELALLIMSNGSRTVSEIASLANEPAGQVAETLAKFRQVNMVEFAAGGPPVPDPSVAKTQPIPTPAAPPAPPPLPSPTPLSPAGGNTTPENANPTEGNPEGVRYWRGKRIT